MTRPKPTRWFLVPCLVAGVCLGACANPANTLVIVQNQVPTFDSMAGLCVVPTDATISRSQGVFDVDLDRAYPYFVYPLIQNRLPSIMTSGTVERNAVSLRAIRVAIKSPIEPHWLPGCPGTFDSPVAGELLPDQTRALGAQGFQSCHAQHLRDLIAAGAIPSDLSQPVFFTLELTAVADHGGSQALSDPFPFPVQVCAGCLQSMFPRTPSCAVAPKPNLEHGNPCNIAQDSPQVLCCTDPSGGLVCPAPDA